MAATATSATIGIVPGGGSRTDVAAPTTSDTAEASAGGGSETGGAPYGD